MYSYVVKYKIFDCEIDLTAGGPIPMKNSHPAKPNWMVPHFSLMLREVGERSDDANND
jgi:hypothetical protein